MVQNSPFRFDNMQIKTRPSAREVAAVYTVEEMSMELVVKLAPNHPLGVVSVESGRKIGIAAAQWRSWMLQMTTFLTHQVSACAIAYNHIYREIAKTFHHLSY